jgi:hypothetical protein
LLLSSLRQRTRATDPVCWNKRSRVRTHAAAALAVAQEAGRAPELEKVLAPASDPGRAVASAVVRIGLAAESRRPVCCVK